MINHDPLFQLVGRHPLPASRGEKSSYDFLKEYYKDFLDDLNSCMISTDNRTLPDFVYVELNSNIDKVKLICNLLIDYLDAYNSGLEKHGIEVFDELMKTISPFLPVKPLGHNSRDRFHRYYRLRPGKVDKRGELFHIPWSKRSRVGAYRYSVSGQPSLYLATGLELCFFECGMPSEFSASVFKLDVPEGEKLNFIDFAINPYCVVTDVDI